MGLCNSLHRINVTSGALAIINPWTFSRFLCFRGLYMCVITVHTWTPTWTCKQEYKWPFSQARSEEMMDMSYGKRQQGQCPDNQSMFPQPNVPLWSQFRLRKTKQQKREEMWTVKMSKWKKEEDNTERENNTLDTLGKLGKGRNMWTIQSKIRGKTQGHARGEKGTEMTPKKNSRIGKQHQQKIH